MKSISLLEPFSNYIFPGIHERSNHSCRRDEDCGNRAGVKCAYLSYDLTHKVCQCRDGWLLDPKSQLCGKAHRMLREKGSHLFQLRDAVSRHVMRIAISNVKDTTASVDSATVTMAPTVVSEKRVEVHAGPRCCSLVLMNMRLELDQVCNRTGTWTYGMTSANSGYLQCDTICERARCIRGYRPDGTRCGEMNKRMCLSSSPTIVHFL